MLKVNLVEWQAGSRPPGQNAFNSQNIQETAVPYVIRNRQQQIIALLREQAAGAEEFLASDSIEIQEFLAQNQASGSTSEKDLVSEKAPIAEKSADSETVKSALADSDRDLARATEDLIQLLIEKNLILFTELPEAVQQKLLNRERLRSSLQQADSFLDDEGLI